RLGEGGPRKRASSRFTCPDACCPSGASSTSPSPSSHRSPCQPPQHPERHQHMDGMQPREPGQGAHGPVTGHGVNSQRSSRRLLSGNHLITMRYRARLSAREEGRRMAMALPTQEKGLGWRRHRTALLLLVFLVPVALATWWTLRRIELLHRQNLQDALTAVVAVSHEGLQLWAEDKKADVASWAQSEHLSQAVVAQLEVPRTAESLKSSPPAERIRRLLLPSVRLHDYSG